MMVVGSHKSAFSRQESKAVRIRWRGGEQMTLNSKAEYNRCHIPRLRVEQEEEVAVREEQQKKQYKRMEEELDGEQLVWGQDKTRRKDKEKRKMVRGKGWKTTWGAKLLQI